MVVGDRVQGDAYKKARSRQSLPLYLERNRSPITPQSQESHPLVPSTQQKHMRSRSSCCRRDDELRNLRGGTATTSRALTRCTTVQMLAAFKPYSDDELHNLRGDDQQTIFPPVIGLVQLKPSDLVGVNKDTLPSEYDSWVKAMEVMRDLQRITMTLEDMRNRRHILSVVTTVYPRCLQHI